MGEGSVYDGPETDEQNVYIDGFVLEGPIESGDTLSDEEMEDDEGGEDNGLYVEE